MEDRGETGELEALLDARAEAGVALRRTLDRQIEERLEAMDPGSVPAGLAERLRALSLVRGPVERELPANAIFVPFTEASGGGLVAAIQVHEEVFTESALAAKMTPDCQRSVERAIRAAAERADRRVSGEAAVDFVTELRGARVGAVSGRSLSLAVFLSAYALYTGRKVNPGTVASADVVDGSLRGVGHLDEKIASMKGRADLSTFLVAVEDEELARSIARRYELSMQVVGVRTLREAIDAAIGGSILGTEAFEDVVVRARERYREGWGPRGWAIVEQAVTPLLAAVPDERPELRVELLTMLAAARRNAGDSAGALDLLDLAAVHVDAQGDWIERRVLAFYHRQRALSLLDQGLFEAALREVEASEEAARAGGLPGDYAVALGSKCLVHLATNQAEAALEAIDEAHARIAERDPKHAQRTQTYRVLALTRLGRVDEAERIVAAMAERRGDGYARLTEAWARAYFAGALLEWGEHARALAVLRDEVMAESLRGQSDLAPLTRLYLGEALVSMGEVRLASSVFERVPAETGARTPFQDRRVALTQIRRAQLAARRAHGAELFEAILPWLEGLFGDALTALRDEVLEGRVGEATRAVAARCARPWEPMVIGGGS